MPVSGQLPACGRENRAEADFTGGVDKLGGNLERV
jgi:hypothetical protein